jgi:hypothetical protein
MSAESDFYCPKCGYEWCAIPPSNCPVCHRRKTKLREWLLNLAAWATTRANGEHDTQTTLSMIRHKTDKIQEQVKNQAMANPRRPRPDAPEKHGQR